LREKNIYSSATSNVQKKNNSSAAADAKKITLAKPAYRRQDAMAPRIFLCVSASWCENKEKNLAKQESR
jgi:hypothetical protein